MDLLVLALVGLEWLAVGRVSGIRWPCRVSPSPAMQLLSEGALALLSGAFLLGFAQLLLALLGFGFASVPLALAVALGLAIVVRSLAQRVPGPRRDAESTFSAAPTRLSFAEIAGWAILAAVLVAAAIRAFLVPESGWDAYSHWALKAQAFAASSTIVDAGTVHEYYPPLVPLLESWLFLHLGAPDIDAAKTIAPLLGAAFAIALTGHLRLALDGGQRPLAPLFGAAIIVSTTQLLEGFWTGQADLLLTAYLTLTALAAWQWLQAPDRRWLVQVALFGGAAVLTKYEGLPRVGIIVAAILLDALLQRCRQRTRPAIALTTAAALAYAPWAVFRLTHSIGGGGEHLGAFQPQALLTMLATLVAVFAGIRTGGAVLVAVAAWLVAGRQVVDARWMLITLIVVGQLAGTLLAFLITQTAPDIQVRTSATRLVEHFLPLALFASAVWLTSIRPIIRAER